MTKPLETANSGQPAEPTLPRTARSKFSGIEPFIGICRESSRKLGIAGKAPLPVRLTGSCSLYDNAEVRRWVADPLSYAAASPADEQAA